MDFFDERVLAAPKDGKPRGFTALLSEAGFSHNTLQQHHERLMAQGLIVREKATANSFGRPKFALSCAIQNRKAGHCRPSRSTL
jgi:predicted ArsR family transcriptional regulator